MVMYIIIVLHREIFCIQFENNFIRTKNMRGVTFEMYLSVGDALCDSQVMISRLIMISHCTRVGHQVVSQFFSVQFTVNLG